MKKSTMMDQKTVEKLDEKIEEVIVKMGLKKLPTPAGPEKMFFEVGVPLTTSERGSVG